MNNTLKIKSSDPASQGPYVVIDAADYDKKRHELYEGPAEEPPPPPVVNTAETAPGQGANPEAPQTAPAAGWGQSPAAAQTSAPAAPEAGSEAAPAGETQPPAAPETQPDTVQPEAKKK